MITSIEMQVISYILTSDNKEAVDTLLGYDASYYSVFKPQILFIHEHINQNGKVPDRFTFQVQFPDFVIVQVNETLEWLKRELAENKKHIILLETFNKLKDLGEGDTSDAWNYIDQQSERVHELESSKPLDIVHDVDIRSQQILDFSNQPRIPTGFDEIDNVMYGGLSTVEELLILEARLNSGKSWVCSRFMESAQRHNFNVAYYSPEMQASFLGTRFDTWRGHFANSQIFRGQYSEEYMKHLQALKFQTASAYIIEDKDAPDNLVTVSFLRKFVKSHNIKELIIDGLSYLTDDRAKMHDTDSVKYKNLCEDLFKLSKGCGCAVVVAMQANRATKDMKDEKGEPFPTIYNIEGSDHPGRIATQVFAIRQIFEKHILDIRLEKSRNAKNQKPVFSYTWDINIGDLSYMPSADDLPTISTPVVNPGLDIPDISGVVSASDINLDIDDVVEF